MRHTELTILLTILTAPKIASELFFGIQFDVNDLENCSPFTLSMLDIEVLTNSDAFIP